MFISSTTVLIRHLWQLKTVVFLHWCLIRVVLLSEMKEKSLIKLPPEEDLFQSGAIFASLGINTINLFFFVVTVLK
jgi:hypothetical protein